MKEKRRNWWPYGIVAAFALFITVQIGLITTAATHFEGPDDDKYYEHGLNYGDEMKRQERQRQLGWSLDVQREGPLLRLAMTDAQGHPLEGIHMEATLVHPATARDDRALHLVPSGTGAYQAPLGEIPGKWRVRVKAVLGQEVFQDQRDLPRG